MVNKQALLGVCLESRRAGASLGLPVARLFEHLLHNRRVLRDQRQQNPRRTVRPPPSLSPASVGWVRPAIPSRSFPKVDFTHPTHAIPNRYTPHPKRHPRRAPPPYPPRQTKGRTAWRRVPIAGPWRRAISGRSMPGGCRRPLVSASSTTSRIRQRSISRSGASPTAGRRWCRCSPTSGARCGGSGIIMTASPGT